MWRVLVAGLLGGITMFIWSAIAHMATPLGRIGLENLPNDAAVTAALEAGAGARPGLYVFPSMKGPEGQLSQAAYAKRLESSPQGLIAYQPAGTPMLTPRQLMGEAALEIIEAIVLAFVLRALVYHAFLSRVAFAGLIGLAVVITTNGSYWNWYGFPANYTLAYAFTQWVGYVAAGFMIAIVYGWWRGKPRAAGG